MWGSTVLYNISAAKCYVAVELSYDSSEKEQRRYPGQWQVSGPTASTVFVESWKKCTFLQNTLLWRNRRIHNSMSCCSCFAVCFLSVLRHMTYKLKHYVIRLCGRRSNRYLLVRAISIVTMLKSYVMPTPDTIYCSSWGNTVDGRAEIIIQHTSLRMIDAVLPLCAVDVQYVLTTLFMPQLYAYVEPGD